MHVELQFFEVPSDRPVSLLCIAIVVECSREELVLPDVQTSNCVNNNNNVCVHVLGSRRSAVGQRRLVYFKLEMFYGVMPSRFAVYCV